MAIGYLSRRATFSAAHRLHSLSLSDAENKKLFGKCNLANGHGHNYVIEIVLRGEIGEKDGIIFNLTDLKEIIRVNVLEKVDHKNLNLDVEEFQRINPTVENIAKVIWDWLIPHLPASMLFEVRVHETENNIAIFRGSA